MFKSSTRLFGPKTVGSVAQVEEISLGNPYVVGSRLSQRKSFFLDTILAKHKFPKHYIHKHQGSCDTAVNGSAKKSGQFL